MVQPSQSIAIIVEIKNSGVIIAILSFQFLPAGVSDKCFPEKCALEHISVVISVPRKIIARAEGQEFPLQNVRGSTCSRQQTVRIRTIIDSERWV